LKTSFESSPHSIINQSKFYKDNTFATQEKLNKSIFEIGHWQTRKDAKQIWSQLFQTTGSSLNFGFSQFFLPPSAVLSFKSKTNGRILFKLDHKSNKPSKEYWTPICKSSLIEVSLEVHSDEKKQVQLTIGTINHGIVADRSQNIDENECMIDVICGESSGFPEIDRYRDIIQSVGMTSINGTRICSGVLINNTRNDKTPYFLSGRHCGIDGENVNSVVVHWNYENSGCRFGTPDNTETGDGDLMIFNSGASIVADYRDSDMILLLLDEPVQSEANAFYAGWDRRAEVPAGGVVIHHPNSLEKRISFDEDQMEVTRHFGDDIDPDQNHLKVGNYELGSTAQGSSGAAFFNKDKRVVGQLHGGRASCEENDADWYGRFFTSWLGEGVPERQLKPWLDPLNSKVEFIDGIWDQPTVELQVAVIQTEENLCFGASEAAIQINVNQGSAPYEYSIDGGLSFRSESIFIDLPANDYIIVVKDADGVLSNEFSFTIEDGAQIVVSSQVLYNQINLKAKGGQEPYRYRIVDEPFQDEPIFRALESGSYTFEVIDVNDCIVSYDLTLDVPEFVVELSIFKDIKCLDDTDGILEVSVIEGGFSPFLYSLDGVNYQAFSVFENVSSGDYIASIQDFIGNIYQTDSVSIGALIDPIMIDIKMFEDFIEVTASGGSGILTYSIDGINFTLSNKFESLPGGTNFFYVMDENGCIAISEAIVVNSTDSSVGQKFDIAIYPNPATDLLYMSWSSTNEIDNVSILSSRGKNVLIFKDLKRQELQIDISGLATGVYLARIESKDGKFSILRTFVINK